MNSNETGADINSGSKDESIINQINQLRSEVDYNTRDYAIDFLVTQFKKGEFFINSDYQRKFVWDNQRKCRFIESILLGYPIPFMFFSDNDDGRCDIVDGAQRTSTLEEFLNNDLVLTDLKKLFELNSLTFDCLPLPIQRKFNKTTLRIIVLEEGTSLDVRQEIFNRINTSGLSLNPTETRRGALRGEFMEFMEECSKNLLFQQLCPMSELTKARHEDIELITRFFAYVNDYKLFEHNVSEFLDSYVKRNKNQFNKKTFEEEFNAMLNFVNKYFPNGFRRSQKGKFVPRARFEAISVGVMLALREKSNLQPAISTDWSDIYTDNGKKFKYHTTTHASNDKKRLIDRIEYVKNMLLFGKEDAPQISPEIC
ncbi:MAG: DUF262 domain-containing protein [Deltaproteobacteria bacterium]|jgi:uncharacterized protein with ParB-like and HNH nuclease domain|nr:DUF262 domain-containing protein [Deltaproteobacteria bacterium]